MISKNKTNSLSIISMLCIIILVLLFVGSINGIRTDNYRTLVEVESDIIRSYHDNRNPDIFIDAQSYLECIGKDTNDLMKYSYCY